MKPWAWVDRGLLERVPVWDHGDTSIFLLDYLQEVRDISSASNTFFLTILSSKGPRMDQALRTLANRVNDRSG